MTDPRRVDPPVPLHVLDAHHAQVLQAIGQWVRREYPAVAAAHADRTRQWYAAAVSIFTTLAPVSDRDQALAYLSQLCAELLLAHAEHLTGKGAS